MCKCWLLHYRICVNVPMWECGLRSSPLYEGFHRLPYLKTPFGDSQMCKATNPHLSHQLRRQPLRRQEAVTEWTDGGTNTVHLVCGNVKMLECGPRPHNLRAGLLDFTNVQPHKPTFKPSTKASATSQAGAVTEWTEGWRYKHRPSGLWECENVGMWATITHNLRAGLLDFTNVQSHKPTF